MDSTVFSLVYFLKQMDTDYSFLYLLELIICERVGKIIARTLCLMHLQTRLYFNNDAKITPWSFLI